MASAFMVGVIASAVSASTPTPSAVKLAASAAVHIDIGCDDPITIPGTDKAAAVVPSRPGDLSRGPQRTKFTSRFTTVAPPGARAMIPPLLQDVACQFVCHFADEG
jgi:hypothetical protein